MNWEHEFSSPTELDDFVSETREIFERYQQTEAARLLGDVQAAAHTTSSEWLGVLGETVRKIEADFAVTPDIQARLDRIMSAVHGAWPEM